MKMEMKLNNNLRVLIIFMASRILTVTIDIFLKGLVLALPLFFLPWFSSQLAIDNMSKLYLLWLIVPLIMWLWFLQGFLIGEIKIKRTRLDLPIVILLLGMSLAAFFSADVYASIFGAYRSMSQPLLALASLVLLYFLLQQIIATTKKAVSLLWLLISSVAAIEIAVIILLFGLGKNFGDMPGRLLQLAVGAWEEIAIITAVYIVLLFGLLHTRGKQIVFARRWQVWLGHFLLAISLLVLLVVNFIPAWWIMLAGVITVLSINKFLKPNPPTDKKLNSQSVEKTVGAKFKKLLWPIIILFFGINFLLSYYIAGSEQSTTDKMLARLQSDYTESVHVASRAIVAKPLFGYGPETFNHVFSLWRSPSLNQTDHWYARFTGGASYIIELLATTGLVGSGIYLFFIAAIIFSIYKRLRGYDFSDQSIGLSIGLAGAIIALIAAQFIYAVNITLLFLLWFLLGLFMAVPKMAKPEPTEIIISLEKNQRIWQVILLVVFIGCAGWLMSLGSPVRYVLAEHYWIKSQNNINQAEQQEELLLKAINLNPRRYQYRVNLAKFYLRQTLEEFSGSVRIEDFSQVEKTLNQSINWAKAAIVEAPFAVITYETLGMIYSAISDYSSDSEFLAALAYVKALELEPTNPVLAAELAKAYERAGETAKAITAYERVLELKADYYEAGINLAKLYSSQERGVEAIAILERLEKINPTLDLFYEQGRIYFNQGDWDEAIIKFQEVINISPNHANALYSIALALIELEQNDEALSYLRRVAALNPDNQEVKDKIGELENSTEF